MQLFIRMISPLLTEIIKAYQHCQLLKNLHDKHELLSCQYNTDNTYTTSDIILHLETKISNYHVPSSLETRVFLDISMRAALY